MLSHLPCPIPHVSLGNKHASITLVVCQNSCLLAGLHYVLNSAPTRLDLLVPVASQMVFVTICRNFWDCGLVSLDDITVTIGDCRVTAGELYQYPLK